MRRWPRGLFGGVCLCLAAGALARPAAAGPYYARGDYYCPGGTCWAADAGNELFDDGLHGDGAAGDGVYGCLVLATAGAGWYGFKIATVDWSQAYPTVPGFELANAQLYLNGPMELVQFTFDANIHTHDGLPDDAEVGQPDRNIVWTDHALPPDAALEVIGSAPELGAWNGGVLMIDRGAYPYLQAWATIAAVGSFEYKFRTVGSWQAAFGLDFTAPPGRNFTFTTRKPNQYLLFQLDPASGRSFLVDLTDVPVEPTTWSGLKALFR